MGTGRLTFGIVSNGFLFWIWLLGQFGECRWIYCKDLLREEWPYLKAYKCVDKESLKTLVPVDVLLFDGPTGPTSTHEVWSSSSINIVV